MIIVLLQHYANKIQHIFTSNSHFQYYLAEILVIIQSN